MGASPLAHVGRTSCVLPGRRSRRQRARHGRTRAYKLAGLSLTEPSYWMEEKKRRKASAKGTRNGEAFAEEEDEAIRAAGAAAAASKRPVDWMALAHSNAHFSNLKWAARGGERVGCC